MPNLFRVQANLNRDSVDLRQRNNQSKQLSGAQMMMGGMSDLKNILRSNIVEAIGTFEQLERQGIDLSKYNI